MKNENLMNKKLGRMTWRLESGVFKAATEITRQPFGEFRVIFEVDSRDGKTVVDFRNEKYEMFNERIESENYESGKAALMRYFDRIELASGEIDKEVERKAKIAYQRVINEEVAKKFASDKLCGELCEGIRRLAEIIE